MDHEQVNHSLALRRTLNLVSSHSQNQTRLEVSQFCGIEILDLTKFHKCELAWRAKESLDYEMSVKSAHNPKIVIVNSVI